MLNYSWKKSLKGEVWGALRSSSRELDAVGMQERAPGGSRVPGGRREGGSWPGKSTRENCPGGETRLWRSLSAGHRLIGPVLWSIRTCGRLDTEPKGTKQGMRQLCTLLEGMEKPVMWLTFYCSQNPSGCRVRTQPKWAQREKKKKSTAAVQRRDSSGQAGGWGLAWGCNGCGWGAERARDDSGLLTCISGLSSWATTKLPR